MYGFNGQNILQKDILFNDTEFHHSLKRLNPSTIRYPGGTIGMYWDWRTGKFLESDFSLSSNNWTPKTYSNRDIEPTKLEDLKLAIDFTGATPLYDLNVVSSDRFYQLAQLYHAGSLNLPIKYAEFGNEIYKSAHSIRNKYPNGAGYANEMINWVNLFKGNTGNPGHFPNLEIALVGATRRALHNDPTNEKYKPIRYNWNDDVLSVIWPQSQSNNIFDINAMVLHPYAGSGLVNGAIYDANINSDCIFSLPHSTLFNDIFVDEIGSQINGPINSGNRDLNIWHTEYNIFDNDSRILGSWAHGLFVAYQSLLYLENENISHVNVHTLLGGGKWGAIFTNNTGLEFGDAVQPKYCDADPNNVANSNPGTADYNLTAAGQTLQQIMSAAKKATDVTKINFQNLDPGHYLNCNNNTIEGVYGWFFEDNTGHPNPTLKQAVLLNFTVNPITVNLDPSLHDLNKIESISSPYEYYITGENETDCYDPGNSDGDLNCDCTYSRTGPTDITAYTVTIPPYSINRLYEFNPNDCQSYVSVRSAITNDVTNTTEICEGTSLGIQANVLPLAEHVDGPYTYLWNTTPAQTTAQIIVSPTTLGNTTYTVTVSNINGCSTTATGSITITTVSAPDLNITSNPIIPIGCGTAPVELNAEIIDGMGNTINGNFVWITDHATGVDAHVDIPLSQININPDETTTYTVYATSDNICYLKDFKTVPVFNIGEDRTVCNNETINFEVSTFLDDHTTGAQDYNIEWIVTEGSTGPTTYFTQDITLANITSYTTVVVNITPNGSTNCFVTDQFELTPINCCITPSPTAINEIEDGTRLSDFIEKYNDDSSSSFDIEKNTSGRYRIAKGIHNNISTMWVFGKFIIDENLLLEGINLKMAEAAEIIIEPCKSLKANGHISGSGNKTKTIFESCGAEMWKGIRVRPETNLEFILDNENVIVKDAEYAIYIESSIAPTEFESSVKLHNAEILNNYVGIFIEPAHAKKNSHVSLDIRESIIDGEFINLKTPYYNQLTTIGSKGYAGIVAHNLDLTLTDVNGTPNTFKNMNIGIYANRESIELENNVFENIFPDSNLPTKPQGTAIYSYGQSFIDIRKNDFYEFLSGIKIANLIKHDLTISDNKFNEGLPLPSDLNLYSYEALRVERNNTSRPLIFNLNIANNIIHNTAKGIHLRNVNSAFVNNNEYKTDIPLIDLQTLVGNNINWTHYGIWIEKCLGTKINKNEIIEWTNPPATLTDAHLPLMRGIAVSNSLNTDLTENKTTNIPAGIRFLGNCIDSDLLCNTMQANYHGVFLDPIGVNNRLTDQGEVVLLPGQIYDPVNSTSWNNKWTNNVDDRVAGALGNPIWVFDWTFDPNLPDRDPGPSMAGFFTARESSLTIGNCSPPARLSEQEREEQFAETVYDSTITDIDSTLMEYMREQAFYKMASENDEVLNQGVPEDADYQTKYNNLETSNTGEIAKADEEIAEGDYATALARINALLDENTHEFNKIAVQEIYINNYAQDVEPNAGTIIQLENIAYSHPFYGGEAVYLARAMLGIDVEDAFPTARLANPNLQLEAEALKTEIYPNPSNNMAYLHVEKSEEQKLTVIVNNVYGKLVYSTTNYNNLIELNTSAYVSGIYLVNVYIDDELITTKKLTVLK